ncbi:hypothetical protein, partial [Staphylococcus rostri]
TMRNVSEILKSLNLSPTYETVIFIIIFIVSIIIKGFDIYTKNKSGDNMNFKNSRKLSTVLGISLNTIILTVIATVIDYTFTKAVVRGDIERNSFLFTHLAILIIAIVLLLILMFMRSYTKSKVYANLAYVFKHNYNLQKKIAIKEKEQFYAINEAHKNYQINRAIQRGKSKKEVIKKIKAKYSDAKEQEELEKKNIRELRKSKIKYFLITKIYLTFFFLLYLFSILLNASFILIIIYFEDKYLIYT